jgi:phosphatidate cytidylyltransferase
MSNTKQRILSAIVMVIILIITLIIGKLGLQALFLVLGLLLIDEFIVNLVTLPRKHLSYCLSIVSFGLIFSFIHFLESSTLYIDIVLNAGVLLNVGLLFYLFFEKMDSNFTTNLFKKYTFLVGIVFLIPISCLGFISFETNWLALVGLICLMNFSIDSGAWFFGKKFGNKKLWPAISPKKTINGAIGGSITGVLLSSVYIFIAFEKMNLNIVLCLAGLSVLGQLGDLIESKFKRQFGVKDSSNLIPGHGGIYDRLDSLLFIGPFFILFVKNFL